MDDENPRPDASHLIDASQEYPSAPQRTAAWRKEFVGQGAFQVAFEHSAIGMGLVDLDGRFLKVNRSLSRIFGYSEAEFLTKDFQSITHRDDLAQNLDLARQLMRGEIDHYDFEKRCVHKLGHLLWVQLSVSIVRNAAGEPCFFASQVQDISVRKAAEQESARRVRQLERLTRTVSGILHAIENTSDEQAYSQVLRILLDSFESQAGLFLRFAEDGVLVGRYLAPDEEVSARVVDPYQCDLWATSLLKGEGQIENQTRQMGCGRVLSRSLVVPIQHNSTPVGLLHLGDAEADYDTDDLDFLTRIAAIVGPVIRARLRRDQLTPREAEVMELIVSGKSQKQIASELDISVQTAAKHRSRVLEKLRVDNDVELVHRAMQMRSPTTGSLPRSIDPEWPIRDSR